MGFSRRLLPYASARRLVTVPVAVAAVVAGTALVPTAAQAAPAASGTATSGTAARPVAGGVQFATLVTGDRVGVTTDAQGRQHVATRPAAGGGSFSSFQLNGDLYVIPEAALPYVGVSLDRSLFDVSALIRDGAAGRVPVRVSFAAGATQSVPGVTVTGTPNATSKDGYLTPAGASDFGAALIAQRRHDARAGLPANRELFGGVTAVRYAGRGPAPVIQPSFPMFTLRINAIGPDGGPLDFGFGTVWNTDDTRKFFGNPVVINGEARISVPAGHYNSIMEADSIDAAGNFNSALTFTEFEVTGAGTVTVDSRRATSQPTFSTPRPAVLEGIGFDYFSGPAEGPGGFGFSFTSNVPFLISPVPAQSVGISHYLASATLSAPEGTAQPYGFELRSPSSASIPADQHFAVTPANLATTRETFAADNPQNGIIFRFAWEPWLTFVFSEGFVVPRPSRNTEYVTARPILAHSTAVIATDSFDSFGSGLNSGTRVYRARQQVSEEWFRGPIAPGFPADPSPDGSAFCNACRSGDVLSLDVNSETDSIPDHWGFLDFAGDGVTSTSRFQLLSGSTVLADQADIVGGDFTVPAANTPYKIVYDQTRIAPWFSTAPVSHTEWTFRSANSPARTVPAATFCPNDAATCSAVSLVDVDYHLNGTLANTMRPGLASMDFTARHTPYVGGPAITRASVSVSFNGGHRFVPALVIPRGHGRFTAVWRNPGTPGPVTLRVRAADAAGSTFDQTIQGAYTIAGGSGA